VEKRHGYCCVRSTHERQGGRKHRLEDNAVNNLTEIMLPERKTSLNELLSSGAVVVKISVSHFTEIYAIDLTALSE
jgi:hypothetical protein